MVNPTNHSQRPLKKRTHSNHHKNTSPEKDDNADNKEEWMVQLYRETSHGWHRIQVRQPAATQPAASSQGPTQRQHPPPHHPQQQQRPVVSTWFRVRVQREAILIPQLCFCLRLPPTSTVVTRRRNRLQVVVVQEHEKAAAAAANGDSKMILVFRSMADVRAFSQSFGRHNPAALPIPRRMAAPPGSSRGMPQPPRTRLREKKDHFDPPPQGGEPGSHSNRPHQEQVFSYVAHLLQTTGFRSYMTNLEHSMNGRLDLRLLLQDLVPPPQLQLPPPHQAPNDACQRPRRQQEDQPQLPERRHQDKRRDAPLIPDGPLTLRRRTAPSWKTSQRKMSRIASSRRKLYHL